MVRWGILSLMLLVAGVRYWGMIDERTRFEAGQKVRMVVRVKGETIETGGRKYLRENGWWVEVPMGIRPEYGSKYEIIGKLEERVTSNGRVQLKLNSESFKLIDKDRGIGWYLVNYRQKLRSNVLRWLGGDEGALEAGILWGGQEDLSRSVTEAFKRTGVAHILAASGYNVAVMASWVMALAAGLIGRRRAIGVAVLSVMLYMALAGWSASVVRAGIMGILTLAGLYLGRPADVWWLLAMTSAGMAAIEPGFVEDVGWQLSVAATAGLVAAGAGEKDYIRSTLRATGATYLTTAPLLWLHFGRLSVVSPVVNLAVLWLIPMAMEVGMVASIVGLVMPAVGRAMMLLVWPVLKYMIWVVERFGGWSGASLELGRIGWGEVGIYYLVVIVIFKFHGRLKT